MPLEKKIVFSTPWFEVLAKKVPGEELPYYCLAMTDYVAILATTARNDLVVVRQFRPAVEAHTLELPSGTVDSGEAPEVAARRELLEETGYVADELEALSAPLFSDTGRLANRMWCYRARNVRLTSDTHVTEAGIETLLLPPDAVWEKVKSGEFIHALHLALLFLGGFPRK
jgi:ADP-ribose pyrophosphatase